MKIRISLVLALLLLLSTVPSNAKDKPAPTAPGKYKDWNGEVDELEILASFKLSDFDRIVIEPLDISATPLPEPDDNTYAPVKNTLALVTRPFAAGLSGRIGERPEKPEVVLAPRRAEPGEKAAPGTLVVRGTVTKMDPGSRAARYWAGFGAGAARTEISGEVADAATGRVLFRFRQERRSGVGAMGGGYEELMERNVATIGNDIGAVLLHF
ncbi:MAG: DUF4410 domain-containing protein [Thermoanaerobaculia bacterium]